SFHSNYLTLEAAKNNPDINSFYKGKNFGTVDSKLKALFKQNNLMDVYKDLESEEDTLTRLEKSFEALKGLGGKENNEKASEIKKQYEQKMIELQSELKNRENYIEPIEMERLRSDYESKFFNLNLNNIISRKQLGEGYDFDEVSLLVQGK